MFICTLISGQNKQPTQLYPINETKLLTSIPSQNKHQAEILQSVRSNYKRKYSDKINRAASSIVNFGAEFNKSNRFRTTDSSKGSFENMSKVIQICVADMIKYSVDLFNVMFFVYKKL